jgi:hypothetical protein
MSDTRNLLQWKNIHTVFYKHKFVGLALILAALAITVVASMAATSEPLSGGIFADDGSVGTITWTIPVNSVTTSDNTYATAAPNDNEITHYLKATNFGFAIPAGSTINGITVEVEKKASNASRIEDYAVRIIKGGNIGITERAAAGFWGTADAYTTYGSTSDKWGESWTVADINNANFGIAFSAYKNATAGNAITASVDHLRITVTYTPNVAPNAPTLVSPANGSSISDNTPTLSANYSDSNTGDTGTTNYRIATSAVNCTTGVVVASGTSAATSTNNENTTWTPSSSIGSDATYYWCAQNDDGIAQSAWTSMGNFILDTALPTVSSVDSDGQTYTSSTVSPHTIKVTFNEDISVTPTISVANDGGAQTVNNCGDADAKTFCFDYTITPTTLATETITISGAQDLAGNTMLSNSTHTFAVDSLRPGLTTVDSDGQTYNTNPTITVSFNRDISVAPTISVAPDGGVQTVNNCSDANVATFCFNYTVPASTEATETITISGAQDTVGNIMTSDNSHTFAVDTKAPTFVIQYFSDAGLTTAIPDNSSLKVGAYYLKITSDEALFGTPTVDIDAEGTANDVTGGASAPVAGNDYVYTQVIAYDVLAVGSVLEDISISGTDLAGNVATTIDPTNEASKVAYTDTIVPTVTDLSTTSADPTNTAPIPVSVTFSESVGDFDDTDVSVTNGIVGNFLGAGTSYTFDVTPGQGLVTIDINGDKAHDAAGNGNTAATQLSLTFDSIRPTVVVSSTLTDPTKVSPIPVTITFSEDVTGFDDSDVAVVNGIKSNFSPVSDSVYTLDVTPSCECTVTVDIADGAAKDKDSNLNDNFAAVTFSITYDTVPPNLTETGPVPAFTKVNTPNYTFTSDEAGTITYGGDCSSATAAASAGPNVITFNALSDALHGNCTIVVTDAAGNDSSTLDVSDFTVDTMDPSVTLSTTDPDPTNSSAIPFTATFSEDVTGLLDTEISVTNGSVSNFAGSGSVYTFDVNPTIDGVVDVQIPAAEAQDPASNDNTISNLVSINVDTSAPTITAAEMKDANFDGKVDQIVLSLDDNLADTASGSNGFDVTSASDHGTCNSETADPDGTSTLIIDFVCSNVETSLGDLTLNLTANAGVADDVGNQVASTVLNSGSVPAITDSAAPVVVSTIPADSSAGIAIGSALTVTFSEPMNTGSLSLSDDDSDNYTGTTWSLGDRKVVATHDDWTSSTSINVNVDADDLTALPLNGGTYSWSFMTQAPANQGSVTVSASNAVTDGSGLDLSFGVSTAGGGNILIDTVSQPLASVTTGDLVGLDLSGPQTVGDQTTTVTQAVTLHSTGDITVDNAGIPSTTMTIPNNTTMLCDGSWDGTVVLRAGSTSGTAPTGFSIGSTVVEAGSPACVLLLDQPITISMTGVTGPAAYKPAGSAVWTTMSACGGTYAAPTLAAPLPFGECSIDNGTDTKIVTYHLTTFGSLVTAATTTTTKNMGGGSAMFGRKACSGPSCEEGYEQENKPTLFCARNESTIVPFTDISEHWAKNYIESMYRHCIIQGKTRTEFAPQDNITRAELIKIVVNAYNSGTAAVNFRNLYQDVKENDWFAPYVMKATKLHIIQGVKIDKFITMLYPNIAVTRAEAVDMIIKARGFNTGSYNSTFSDVKKTDKYYASIAFAQTKGVVIGRIQTLGNSGLASKFYSVQDLQIGQSPEKLKELLIQLDYYRGEINGERDDALVEAIKTYQNAKGLEATGETDARTIGKLRSEYLNPKVIRYFDPDRQVTRAEISKMVDLVQNL